MTTNVRAEIKTDHAHQESQSWTCNIIVLSSAGKPIYARHGTDMEIGRICGLVQAVRSSIRAALGGNDIRSLRSGKRCIVFMTVGELTLVAIGTNHDTEAFLKLQLEYTYGHILFTLTERVHDYFTFDPGFDLRSVLGTADATIIHGILQDLSPLGNPGPFLLGSVETLFPISPAIRARAVRALHVTSLKTDFTLFGLLTLGEKLIAMVETIEDQHLPASDLHLLLKAINRQPLLSSELWFPVCLPRFNPKDFLFCYTQCWDEDTKQCLILLSAQGTTHQFQLFQEAAASIRRSLDLPAATGQSTVLEILDSSATSTNGQDHNRDDTTQEHQQQNGNERKDVKWRRCEEDPNLDQDYVEISYGDLDAVLPYLPSPPRSSDSIFLREVQAASNPQRLQGHIEHYRAIGSALHFLFRLDGKEKLSQCVGSTLEFPFVDEVSKQKVWSTYQQLRLRLCLGSATPEATMKAWDTVVREDTESKSPGQFSSMKLATLSPSDRGYENLAFVMDKTELYIAMKGRNYEYYTVVPGTTSLKEATTAATKLVRRLFADQRSLFQCG